MGRRHFLSLLPLAAAAVPGVQAATAPRFRISLAQWSLHRALQGGRLDPLDWPRYTKATFGIDALEHVNQFYATGDRAKDRHGLQPKPKDHFTELAKRISGEGMHSVLIMCDGVGNLGDPDPARRTDAVEGHYAWLDTALLLGCHSIRVNAGSNPKLMPEEQARLCADGLRRLSEAAASRGLNVIVENHGGLSSDGSWLASVMRLVGSERCGTLPDFGNFYLARNRGNAEEYQKQKALFVGRHTSEDEKGIAYDRYQGVEDLMPFAKGVSAKSHDFNDAGDELHTDFARMMRIVAASGYSGHVGIEYEGAVLSEDEGILKTKALLERVLRTLA
ncbi:MAG: TIM barrel protein [Verrucomicrobia bacterium]|nr:TIM barrel protein [Verrucomicrobiota bacterium]